MNGCEGTWTFFFADHKPDTLAIDIHRTSTRVPMLALYNQALGSIEIRRD